MIVDTDMDEFPTGTIAVHSSIAPDSTANQEEIDTNPKHLEVSLEILRANQSSIESGLANVKAQQQVLKDNQQDIDANLKAIESLLFDHMKSDSLSFALSHIK